MKNQLISKKILMKRKKLLSAPGKWIYLRYDWINWDIWTLFHLNALLNTVVCIFLCIVCLFCWWGWWAIHINITFTKILSSFCNVFKQIRYLIYSEWSLLSVIQMLNWDVHRFLLYEFRCAHTWQMSNLITKSIL